MRALAPEASESTNSTTRASVFNCTAVAAQDLYYHRGRNLSTPVSKFSEEFFGEGVGRQNSTLSGFKARRMEPSAAAKPKTAPPGRRRLCAVKWFAMQTVCGGGIYFRRAFLRTNGIQKETTQQSCVVSFWCARRESNPHALASTGT